MARNDPQVNLRLPAELKQKLDAVAHESKRSLTAEIVERLETSFSTWPHLSIDPWIMDRVNAAPPLRRLAAEGTVNDLVEQFLNEQFPDPFRDANQLSADFSTLLRRAPEGLRAGFQTEFEQLVRSIIDAEERDDASAPKPRASGTRAKPPAIPTAEEARPIAEKALDGMVERRNRSSKDRLKP